MNTAALARALRDLVARSDDPDLSRFVRDTVDLLRRVGRTNVYPSALPVVEEAKLFSAAWDADPGEGPADVFAPQRAARSAPDMSSGTATAYGLRAAIYPLHAGTSLARFVEDTVVLVDELQAIVGRIEDGGAYDPVKDGAAAAQGSAFADSWARGAKVPRARPGDAAPQLDLEPRFYSIVEMDGDGTEWDSYERALSRVREGEAVVTVLGVSRAAPERQPYPRECGVRLYVDRRPPR